MSARPAHILVAEDDKSVRLVVQQALARQGYTVQSSGTAAGLWKMIEQGRGDVLISDVALPDGDAFQLLPKIIKNRPGMPVIVMSARATLLTAVKARQTGVFEYLPKPFELRSLVEATHRAVGSITREDVGAAVARATGAGDDTGVGTGEAAHMNGRGAGAKANGTGAGTKPNGRKSGARANGRNNGAKPNGRGAGAVRQRDAGARAMAPSAALAMETIADNGPLVGRSPAMQEVFRVMARLVDTDLGVLVSGETGTGKHLVARCLHELGRQSGGPFVRVGLSALAPDGVEGEIFGRADAGAKPVPGRIAQAEGGTLFLDEIGVMPAPAQARLLRLFEQGEYVPIGAAAPVAASIRVMASTSRNLARLVDDGAFREDLYYRLNVIPLRLPPLRERTRDIRALVARFCDLAADGGHAAKRFNAEAIRALEEWRWRGNVRELENLVTRLAVTRGEEIITGAMVRCEIAADAPQSATPIQGDDLGQYVEAHMRGYFEALDGPPAPGLYANVIRDVERPLIAVTLDSTRGNQLKAARILGVNRNTLRKRIRELGIREG